MRLEPPVSPAPTAKQTPIQQTTQPQQPTRPNPAPQTPVQLGNGGINNKRKKRNLGAILAALVILLIAAGLTFWFAKKWNKNTKNTKTHQGNSSQTTKRTPEENWLENGWKKDAAKVLASFMKAKSPDERMKYVIPNEGVKKEIETYYPKGTDDSDTPLEFFGYTMGSPEDHKRGIFLMQYRQPAQIDIRDYFAPIGSLEKVMGQEKTTLMDMAYRIDEDNLAEPIGINAFFKKTSEGLKLDASVFIQGKFRTFRAFIDFPQPGKSKIFRVVASESLSHEYRNNKDYRTYRLEDFAYPSDFVNLPVLVNSEVGKVLSQLNWRGLNRPRLQRTATVRLAWSNESPSRLQIREVVCWEFLGVGGEKGNTSEKPSNPTPTPDQ